MRVLKTAIAGLALISVTIPSRADVITDWNQAAMDVMKAVNVAGNPWTRTLAIMHVAMSDAVNAVHTLIAWDSLDQASAYFNSLPFKELQPLRDKAAKVRNFHVEGVAR
jgi:uncharacterized protein (DUF1330 family)